VSPEQARVLFLDQLGPNDTLARYGEKAAVAAILAASSAATGEAEKLRHKLWMVACHATGGGIPEIEGIDRSVNDICVQISASRNIVYQAGKDEGARAAIAKATGR
jgi:hypothetical protein